MTPGKRWPSRRRACLGQLVQHERTAGDLGEDGEQPGAGRGFQNPIGCRDGRRGGDREAKRDRRRELLERLALLGATRVGGEKARDLREHRQCGGRRPGFTEKHFAVFAEEQHRRRLAGVVGGFPIPGAGRIGGAEGRLHRGAQDTGVDAATTFEIGKEKPRGLGDGGGCSRKRWRSRTGGRGAGRIRHEGDLGRAGTGRAAGRSLSTRSAQTRPGRPLALVTPLSGALGPGRTRRDQCLEIVRPDDRPVVRF